MNHRDTEFTEERPESPSRPLRMRFDSAVSYNIFVGCTTAVTDAGSLSQNVSYNDFYNNATNFTGYSPVYGTVIWDNRNGAPANALYNIYENPQFVASNNFQLETNSPCANGGMPGGAYPNLCFPPSIATNYPDMGSYGGPDACNWLSAVPVLPAVGESLSVSNGYFWLNWGAVPRSSYQVLYSLGGAGSPAGPTSNRLQSSECIASLCKVRLDSQRLFQMFLGFADVARSAQGQRQIVMRLPVVGFAA